SPYGDTIELRYSPDDNDGAYAAGSGSILSRYRQLVSSCNESIFFMSDAWWSSAGADALRDDIIAKSGIIWRGCAGYDAGFPDWDVTTKSNFEADANGTLRNQPGGFNQLHSKVFIFDMEIVATGSANMSASAMYDANSNDEVNIIVHDFRLARRYMNHYHHIMTNSGVTNDPSSDGYDGAAPNAPSNFTVTPGFSNFSATWTPSTSTDISRYYIFVDTLPITKNRIGDRIDDDLDGYYDEDPIGNADGFSSGAADNLSDLSANDDDADGSADEDPWMNPEVMVKTTSGASCIISSWNVGDTFSEGINYYFAIVAVDTQGNESPVDTCGPYMLATVTNVQADTSVNISADTFFTYEPNITVFACTIAGSKNGDILDTFTLKNNGNMDSNQVQNIKIWFDNGNYSWDSGDTYAGSLKWVSTKTWFSDTMNITLPASGSSFIITFDASQNAINNNTFQAYIPAGGLNSQNVDTGPEINILNPFVMTCSNTLILKKYSDMPSYQIYKNINNVNLLSLEFYANPYSDKLNYIAVQNNGNANGADFSNLELYDDRNLNGYDISDTYIGELIWNGSFWDTNTLSYPLLSGANHIIITGDFSDQINTAETVQIQLKSNGFKTMYCETQPPAAILNSNISTCNNLINLTPLNLTTFGYFKNSINAPVFIFRINGLPTGDTLNVLEISNSGTLDNSKLKSLTLWNDANADSSLNTGIDNFIDTFTHIGSNIYRLTGLNIGISNSSFIIAANIDSNALSGDTFKVYIQANSCKTLFGDLFPLIQTNISDSIFITNTLQIINNSSTLSTELYKEQTNVTIFAFRISGNPNGDTLLRIILESDGTLDSSGISAMKLYADDGNYSFNQNDTFLISFSAVSGYSNKWQADTEFQLNSTTNFIIVMDVSNSGNNGETFVPYIPAYGVITHSSDSGPLTNLSNNIIDTLVVPIVSITINQNKGGENVFPGDTGITVLSFQITGFSGGDTLSTLSVKSIGSVSPDSFYNLKLYIDNDSNFTLSASDSFINTLSYRSSDNVFIIDSLSNLIKNTNMLITCDLNYYVSANDTLQFCFPAYYSSCTLADTGPSVQIINNSYYGIDRTCTIIINNESSKVLYDNDTSVI
ncbi:phosphatidylserine/phosphatidylglycerophosphate/cardiolipin synthase family protein, partial [Candidatus Dependentiae bacterium]|nr:phosphatidylserine/phosphatidylglycerophosphate/cardiolipin synthase family protein [Candidatus Dependentiae bacterium]